MIRFRTIARIGGGTVLASLALLLLVMAGATLWSSADTNAMTVFAVIVAMAIAAGLAKLALMCLSPIYAAAITDRDLRDLHRP